MDKSKSPAHSRQIPGGFWSALLLAVISFAAGINFLPELTIAKTPQEYVANSIPFVLGTASLVSAVFILRKRIALGGTLLITTILLLLMLVPTLAEGYGFPAAIAAFVFTSLLGWQTLPRNRFTFATIAGVIAAALIIFIDVFWPFRRIGQDQADIQTTTYLVIILSVAYLIILATQFPRYPLANKLVLSFILIAIIPVAAVTIVSTQRIQRYLTANANQSLINAANQTGNVMETFFERNLDELRIDAQNVALVNYISRNPWSNVSLSQREGALTTLTTLIRKDPINIISYGLISPQGVVVLDTDANLLGDSVESEPYVLKPLETGLPYVSSVYFNQQGNQVIYFTAPIRNSLGQITGLLRMSIDASVLQQNLLRTSQNLGKETTLMLIDENGLVLAHNKATDTIYKTLVPIAPAFRQDLVRRNRLPTETDEQSYLGLTTLAENLAAIKEKPNFAASVRPGVSTSELVGAARLESTPWYVIAAQTEAVLLAPVNQQTRIATLLGLGAILFAILIGSLGSTFLSRPIRSLTEAAEQVAAGNLAVQAPIMTQDEIGTLAGTFNNMAGQLGNLIGTLEQRVADRTRALQTSSEVSRRLSTILDESQLIHAVVDQLQTAFDYYHVHIYLYDGERQNLVMRGGSGEPGRMMLAAGHKITPGRGLVGGASQTNQPVLVGNVREDPNWLPNPLLPETKSELAVPIAIGDEVLGVVDVQQNITDGLGQQDVALVQAIASQVAIALRNARAYTQAQRQAEREALVASLSQRLQRAVSMDDVLQTAVNELGRVLGAQRGSVELRANGSQENN